ncbi:MAG: CAP domain-containing protein [Lachnospiraceae bacterium]|nr:CAP domain-containing protein [Lachnospiraceae bacterium]
MKKAATLLITSVMVCSLSVVSYAGSLCTKTGCMSMLNSYCQSGVKGISLNNYSSFQDLCDKLGITFSSDGYSLATSLLGCGSDTSTCTGGSCNADTSTCTGGSCNSSSEENDDEDEDSTGTISSSYASQVVAIVNQERKAAGLSTLSVDSKVTAAAEIRAKEMVQLFSHTRPDGTSCFTALDEAGASYSGAGENIAMGQKTAEKVMDSWMNSAGHKANILNANFKNIGVGVYTDESGKIYWVQEFTY